jgi:hypothetical protein
MAAYRVEPTTKAAKTLPVTAHKMPATAPPTQAAPIFTLVLVTKTYTKAKTNDTSTIGITRPAMTKVVPKGSIEVSFCTSALEETEPIMPRAAIIRIGPTSITLR